MNIEWELLLRLALGAVYGGVIGFERQIHGRPAGFRTQMLVCIASVLLMEVSELGRIYGAQDASFIRLDPGRIAAGAITGIGFLGAGVIIKMGVTVQGLTTAACLWMVAAIGLALGAGLYVESTGALLLTLFTLLALRVIERHTSRLLTKFLEITAVEGMDEKTVLDAIKISGAFVQNVDYQSDSEKRELRINYAIGIYSTSPLKNLLDNLTKLDGIKRVEIRSY